MTTGSQGEPTSALVRIANRDHRDVHIVPGDTVVVSATPIPGNETVVSRTLDNLFRQGARVLYDKVALVHVHGHASQEELKLMLNLTRPRFFVPVHGEHRHLIAHATLAQALGVPPSNTFVLENGDVLELTAQEGQVVDQVPAGPVFVDGRRMWDVENGVLRDRRALSRDGIVVVVVTQERGTGRVLGTPRVVSSGFVDSHSHGEMAEDTAQVVIDALNHGSEQPPGQKAVRAQVEDAVGRFLHQQTGRRPMIVPVLLEV
jgi:ribonuclease J